MDFARQTRWRAAAIWPGGRTRRDVERHSGCCGGSGRGSQKFAAIDHGESYAK